MGRVGLGVWLWQTSSSLSTSTCEVVPYVYLEPDETLFEFMYVGDSQNDPHLPNWNPDNDLLPLYLYICINKPLGSLKASPC